MAITAEQVKTLREKTGAGMMDCKKALTESDGDFDKAIEILRKKGAAVAAKRAERSANEGVVLTYVSDDKKMAVIAEVNCETDFVANSDDFKAFSQLVLDTIIKEQPAGLDELMSKGTNGKVISAELDALIGKIGEKITVTRFSVEKVEDGVVVDYVHHGAKLGVLVAVEGVAAGNKDEVSAIAKDAAMQVAAMKPMAIYREDIPQNVIDQEIDIYKELLRKEGKPEQMLEKIAQGKLNKFYQENCLFEQAYIKDNSKTIGDLFKEFNQKYSVQSKMTRYLRYHLSDEKK